MAAGDLTITLTESVELDDAYGGETRAYTNTKTISSIVNTFHRVVKCTNDQTTIVASFNSDAHAASGPHLDLQGTKYVRFTNLDGSNTIHLLFKGATDNFTVELQPGASHMMGPSDNYMVAHDDTTYQTGNNSGDTSLEDLAEIAAHPIGTAVVNLEIFAAGIAPA